MKNFHIPQIMAHCCNSRTMGKLREYRDWEQQMFRLIASLALEMAAANKKDQVTHTGARALERTAAQDRSLLQH